MPLQRSWRQRSRFDGEHFIINIIFITIVTIIIVIVIIIINVQVCRQLYTEHKLLSLTANGQLEVDSFKVRMVVVMIVMVLIMVMIVMMLTAMLMLTASLKLTASRWHFFRLSSFVK